MFLIAEVSAGSMEFVGSRLKGTAGGSAGPLSLRRSSHPSSRRGFRIPFDAAGQRWVRFSAWDSAGNGAFTQPVHLK